MFYRILFFFIFFLLNSSIATAGNHSFCGGSVNFKTFKKIDNLIPQSIEVEVFNYRKWQKNNLRIIKDMVSDGFYGAIAEKYKENNFKAIIHVKFDNKVKCSFDATIRQHGDFHDHIKLVDGKVTQSLDVKLKNGHINGITSFKLFIPETRKNPNEEIFITELLRLFGFLGLRTYFVDVNLNDMNSVMLFQERPEKETLEFHLRREGPILEGDERYMTSLNDVGIYVQLARQSNSDWSQKGEQHQNISFKASTLINQFYLLNRKWYGYRNNNPNYYADYFNLDNKFLAQNNPKQISNLELYNAIIFATYAQHSLIPHNRIFFWNSIKNYFEPIYYDGDIDIERGFSEPSNIPNKEDFLVGINNAKNKIKNIDIDEFYKKIEFRRSTLSKKETGKKLKKILKSLDSLKTYVTKNIENDETKISKFSINKEIIKYIDSSVDTKKKIYLVFRNPQTKIFHVCENVSLKCEKINFTAKETKDLLRGRLLLNSFFYQYIGDYLGIENELNKSSILDITDLSNFNNFKFKNTNFYYDKGISFEFTETNSAFNINQTAPGARAFFNEGSIENLSINFKGYKVTEEKEIPNYPIDERGLTGCLTFIDMRVENININSDQSSCEDTVNLINVKGSLNKVNIKKSFSDALDIDFSNISINIANISEAKNDCVDLSTGKYKLNQLNLITCGDKALSVGEKSYLQLNEIKVENSNTGIASKDSSVVFLENGYFKNLNTCISAYKKKQEFSGGFIEVKKLDCRNSLNEEDMDIFSEIRRIN